MHRVDWTDAAGHSHSVQTDETDARDLYAIIVRTAIRGQAMDVLLFGADGNCLDSWGT